MKWQANPPAPPKMNSEPDIQFAVVIPAYRPSDNLVDLIRALSERGVAAIVIVDDGSGPEFQEVFSRAARSRSVHLLRHAVNLGRGAALKTAIDHALCTFSDLAGVVTADSGDVDDAEDILRVAAALKAHPESLILGCRRL